MATILLVLVLTASLLGEVVIPSWGRGMPPLSRDFLVSDFAITLGDFWACCDGTAILVFIFDSLDEAADADDDEEAGFLGNVEVWKRSDLKHGDNEVEKLSKVPHCEELGTAQLEIVELPAAESSFKYSNHQHISPLNLST